VFSFLKAKLISNNLNLLQGTIITRKLVKKKAAIPAKNVLLYFCLDDMNSIID
jgi:hypothetical protein